MYQSGLTVKGALAEVARHGYVLPAIQREFVWKPEQVCRLFDSMMQGYPFGTFLFWRVAPEESKNFKFYGFVRDYHERDDPHCPELGVLPNQELVAVLDGQQRLTALNIGLRGSMAVKEPGKWKNNPSAYPKRTLHLDLLAPLGDEEEGEAYRFRFIETERAKVAADALWYPVGDVLAAGNVAPLLIRLHGVFGERGLGGDNALFERASNALARLHEVVHVTPAITYYEEKKQQLDRVLRIFVRMNSGGTPLSYSDLLLSIAVAQWSKLDARQEIHGLVDELNGIGSGLGVGKDFVLKAGLMLADIASVGFKVENFDRANMQTLEKVWPAVREALVRTVELATSFGLTEQSLRADSALLPIAYYIYRRRPPTNWPKHPAHAGEREAIRGWLVRSLVKPSGIWGSGLDTLLTALREVITAHHDLFPAAELERAMAARGKGLDFGPEEIDDLLDLEYGDRRLFPLLSLLYPFVDVSQHHHVDHIFPKSRLHKTKLERAGLDGTAVAACVAGRDRLPNLQLLEGTANMAKSAVTPAEWFETTVPDPAARAAALALHDIGDPPCSVAEFPAFLTARRERMRARLVALLGKHMAITAVASGGAAVPATAAQ